MASLHQQTSQLPGDYPTRYAGEEPQKTRYMSKMRLIDLYNDYHTKTDSELLAS